MPSLPERRSNLVRSRQLLRDAEAQYRTRGDEASLELLRQARDWAEIVDAENARAEAGDFYALLNSDPDAYSYSAKTWAEDEFHERGA